MTDLDLKRNNLMRFFEKFQVPLGFGLFYLNYFVIGMYVYRVASLCDLGTTYSSILMQLSVFTASVFFMWVLPKPFREFGFVFTKFSLLRVALMVFLLQLPGNYVLVDAIINGLPIFSNTGSYPVVIVMYTVTSPVAEEVFYRGLIQTLLEPLSSYRIKLFKVVLSAPVIASACFFSFVHAYTFSYWDRLDVHFIFLNLALMTTLGLVCGYLREKHGSLLPAICAHALYNLFGGVLFKIVVDLVN